jgi:hypothetical protein
MSEFDILLDFLSLSASGGLPYLPENAGSATGVGGEKEWSDGVLEWRGNTQIQSSRFRGSKVRG